MAGSSGLLSKLESAVFAPSDSEEQKLHKTLLIFASGLMGFAAIFWLAIYWSMGIKFPPEIPLGYQLASAASLIAFLKNKNFPLFRLIQVTMFLFVPFIMQWSIGSYVAASGVMLWALLAPIGVLIAQGPRESIPWFIAYLVLTAVSGFFDYYIGQPSTVPLKTVAVFFGLNFAAVSTIVYFLIHYSIREKQRLKQTLSEQHELLAQEQEKSERLLLNVLPGPVAKRLKQGERTIADGFADVTVMFADITGFTTLSEEMAPSHVVHLLNEVFSGFDQLAERHGLEKIKTIGDAYMVAGGLQASPGEYCEAVAAMALAMHAVIAQNPLLAKRGVSVHIGIATGPAVGGVIGQKKFVYDLWGNTVNLASRLSAEAEAGSIKVDVTTYKRLRHIFQFEGPQLIALKGRGEMPTYRLIGAAREPVRLAS
ncbi:MAG TPA: adenylate/guanylate cyclase domain-containing protein [Burkholderiales bacterium]|nr:adenylate/guanylate cyclase domain-containing protein [Burkholderiales bacterium]